MFQGKKEEELPPGDGAPQAENSTDGPAATESAASQPVQLTAEQKIAELEGTVAQLRDQMLRKVAEYENSKRRLENEASMRVQYATERLLEDMLSVVDDFERSIKMSKGRNDFDALYNGVELIYQKMLKLLSARGLKPFESVGKPFHTDFHDALMQVPKADVPPHTVLEEVEKGYMLNDRVLRHAKVVVSADDEHSGEQNSGSAAAPEIGQA